jgi:hypothetical protein
MALKLKKPVGTATTTTAMVDGKAKTTIAEESHEEKVAAPEPEASDDAVTQMALEAQALEPWAEVQVDASYTKNLGNFQSAKIGVSLKMPARVAELDETFVFTRDWVNGKLEGMIADLDSE